MNMPTMTSLHVYRTEILPQLGARQRTVYDLLESNINMTNKEIASQLNCDVCSITGRIKELRDLELVFEDGKRPCRITGRTATSWKVNKDTLF